MLAPVASSLSTLSTGSNRQTSWPTPGSVPGSLARNSQCLEEEPDQTALELLVEFQARYPGHYHICCSSVRPSRRFNGYSSKQETKKCSMKAAAIIDANSQTTTLLHFAHLSSNYASIFDVYRARYNTEMSGASQLQPSIRSFALHPSTEP